MSECRVDECDRTARAQGLCNAHYQRLAAGKPLTDPVRPRRKNSETAARCSVAGCEKNARARQLCETHYKRWHTHGDPTVVLKPTYKPRPRSERLVDKNGYVLVYEPEHPNAMPSTGYIMEHRYVMAEHLGRPLTESETVHHKNAIRSDNRIENLELWSTNHQAGARVEDQVAHARAVLAQYGTL